MRKQLAIAISLLALSAFGGVGENNVSTNLQSASPQYVHHANISKNISSLLGAKLDLSEPNRSSFQTAAVHFIVGDQGVDFSNDDAKNNDFSDPSGETCKRLGYTVTSCASGLFNSACPYNDKIYDRCCDVTYKYSPSQCSSPKKLSSDKCGGKYKCYCDTRTYPYASCNSPQIKGSSCSDDTGTRYATCTCPGSVATPYGCETYYASPCNNVCQKAYADNCRNRTAVQTPYGCETYFSDCSSKCQKAYADNCRNQTAVIASCPTNADCNYFADCQSKVQSWSCKSGYVQSGNSCINPCDLRTAVISSCPANASCSYFSDCSSKIQSWECNSGYEKSGNTCKKSNPCEGYYSCGGKWQYCKGTTCSADSSMCSIYCPNDMYPYSCSNSSECNGRYKDGYCSTNSCSSGGSGGDSGGTTPFTCPAGYARRNCSGMSCCCPPGGDCSRTGVGSGRCMCQMNPNL